MDNLVFKQRQFQLPKYLFALAFVCLVGTLARILIKDSGDSNLFLRQFTFEKSSSLHHNSSLTLQPMAMESSQMPIQRNGLRFLQIQVQKSFHLVQYPNSCQGVKFFVCNLGNGNNGFGSRIHEVVFCHFLAYNLHRVLVLRNAYFDGLEEMVLTLDANQSCSIDGMEEINIRDPSLYDSELNFDNSAAVVGHRHIWDSFPRKLPTYLPGSVPMQIADLLKGNGIDPALWYIGQSAHFITARPYQHFEAKLTALYKKLQLSHPYVGLQIRHSDKGREARLIPTLSYMSRVEDYFRKHRPNTKEKTVYVATDDAAAVPLLQKHYPVGYRFIGRHAVAKEAGTSVHGSLYRKSAIEGLITDLFILIKSEFVVCTFSSNLGRLVHELRQAEFLSQSSLPLYSATTSMDSGWSYTCPAYGYSSVSSGARANARRNVPERQEGSRYFRALTKEKWYIVKVVSMPKNDEAVAFMGHQRGYAMAKDLLIYPLRTDTTEERLRKTLDLMKSEQAMQTS